MAVPSPSESESESDIRSRGNGKRQHGPINGPTIFLFEMGDGVTHTRNTFPKFQVPTGRVLGNTSVHFVHHPPRNRSRYSTLISPTVFLPQYKKNARGVQYPENATVVVHVQNQSQVNKKK